ncbi:MAG: diguanylate cyclase [Acidobacteria bacterium RIFCSPLOWO2_02_FULL_61_28]|nr:MAG: diguanylate cyclase [Acidobacteria bacterium RIFCSPLOWO2_02_FULL_61_28]
MKTYILKRLLLMIPTMLGITVITFAIIRLAPGDPAAMRLGSSMQGMVGNQQLASVIIEKTRQQFGLDKPLHVQYGLWLKSIVTLDFGRSYRDNRPVMERVWERLPVTLELNLISIFLIYVLAIPIGIYSSTHQYALSEKVSTVFLFILYSLPSFWIATLLILFLGGGDYLHWFPITGIRSLNAEQLPFFERLLDHLWHMVLPVTCLTYGGLAYVSRQMRAGMLETIRQDYIRTARAKGLSENAVIYKHALRNSLIPIVTLGGLLLAALFGGSVIIENIFTIPGMGQLGFDAILSRDYPVVMAISTIAAFLTLVGLLISDLCYAIVNPTISLEGQ